MTRFLTRPGKWMLALALIMLAVVAAGCLPAAKAERLADRVRSELADRRPHPEFVPTPLGDSVAAPSAPLTSTLAITATPALVQRVGPVTIAIPGLRADQPGSDGPGPAKRAAPAAGSAARPAAGSPARPATGSPVETATGSPAEPATGSAVGPVSPLSTAPVESAPAPTAVATATAVPAYGPAKPAVALTGLNNYWQGWNNCGPATLAMNLSYYGSKLDQNAIAAVLRPDRDDKNVNPDELANYARSQGFQAEARVNGDSDRLRLLLSNGVPVLVETWMEPKPNDGMGHYRLLTGYDDAARQWIAYDSYETQGVDPHKPYAGIRLGYDELDSLWRVFDRTYIVVYTEKQAAAVAGILALDADQGAMWQRAEAQARAELQAHNDGFGWFNLGTDLVGEARYADAAAAFDQARRLGLPWRMLWYQFAPFRAYYEVGRYREVVALADATLKTVDNLEEVHYWRGMGLKGLGDAAGARQAWQRAVQLNRNYQAPAEALAQLGQ